MIKKMVTSAVGLQLVTEMKDLKEANDARFAEMKQRHADEVKAFSEEHDAASYVIWKKLCSELDIPDPGAGEMEYRVDVDYLDLGVAFVIEMQGDLFCDCPSCIEAREQDDLGELHSGVLH